MESSPYLKRRGRKAFVVSLFCDHNLYHRVTVSCTLSPISFFPSDKIFQFSFKLRRTICTLLLCNKKYRSPCSFKRKLVFISLCHIKFINRKKIWTSQYLYILFKQTSSIARNPKVDVSRRTVQWYYHL